MVQRYGPPWGKPWTAWPAGKPQRVAKLANVYEFSRDWANADDLLRWEKNNPDKHEIVTALLARRRALREQMGKEAYADWLKDWRSI